MPPTRRSKKIFFRTLDWISLLNVISGALGIAELFNAPLTAFVAPGFVSALLFLCFADSDNMNVTKGNQTIIKLTFWTQIALITLKIDDQITTWAFVFLMLFYIIVFFMSVSIGFFILAISYLCQYLRTASIDSTGIGLFWNFFNSLFSWIWGFTVLGIIDGLDGDSTEVLQPCLLVGLWSCYCSIPLYNNSQEIPDSISYLNNEAKRRRRSRSSQ